MFRLSSKKESRNQEYTLRKKEKYQGIQSNIDPDSKDIFKIEIDIFFYIRLFNSLQGDETVYKSTQIRTINKESLQYFF